MRQPEVSLAMKELKDWGWVNEREVKKKGKSRIAKKTIERWDGHIHVEDNEPNGAVFVIKLRTAQDYSGIRTSLGLPASQTPVSNTTSTNNKEIKQTTR